MLLKTEQENKENRKLALSVITPAELATTTLWASLSDTCAISNPFSQAWLMFLPLTQPCITNHFILEYMQKSEEIDSQLTNHVLPKVGITCLTQTFYESSFLMATKTCKHVVSLYLQSKLIKYCSHSYPFTRMPAMVAVYSLVNCQVAFRWSTWSTGRHNV